MKKIAQVLFTLLPVTNVLAIECDCSRYPFQPNPPCFGRCVDSLSSREKIDFSSIKNIDPGVAVGIKILAARKIRSATYAKSTGGNSDIDFKRINEKADLEREALKSLNDIPTAMK